MTQNKGGIYIHIPFCLRKCNYCAFLSGPSDTRNRVRYVEALCAEIRLRAPEMPEADTVYFGGGTPSLLTPEQIDQILVTVKENFILSEDAEITLEANPGTLTAESLKGYRSAGVNRLSMGVQSMDDRRLSMLGRIHSAAEAALEFSLAREAGYDNINLDLMFGIPGMTLTDALTDLKKIAELDPEHISFYSLQLEEGTPFFRQFEEEKLQEVPDELDREMYHRGIEFLKSRGYQHYEISNLCKPGRASKHNSKYWNMSEYLGLGLGASSYVNHQRSSNTPSIAKYQECLEQGKHPIGEMHRNSEFDDVSEAVFTGLRRREGVQFSEVAGSQENFFRIYESVWDEVRDYEESGDLILTEDGMRLTERGIDISNRIMALFV